MRKWNGRHLQAEPEDLHQTTTSPLEPKNTSVIWHQEYMFFCTLVDTDLNWQLTFGSVLAVGMMGLAVIRVGRLSLQTYSSEKHTQD